MIIYRSKTNKQSKTNKTMKNTVYIVFNRDPHKSADCEIFGAYLTKDEAIKNLVGYITDEHDVSNCKIDLCEQCGHCNDVICDLTNTNQTEETYEIIEMVLGKKWYC